MFDVPGITYAGLELLGAGETLVKGSVRQTGGVRILVVEDEDVMAEAIAAGLRRAGYAVDVALDGGAALDLCDLNPYDVVLLDRDLPVVHGDNICRQLVEENYPARLLMLTASGTVDDRVDGLQLGADDYLPKPFAFRELLARVEALARRPTRALPPIWAAGTVRIDVARHQVTRDGVGLDLTHKEFGVLLELVRAGGAWLSAERLLEKVWDEAADPFSNVVRITMARLRKKLGDDVVIETSRGVGYRLAIPTSQDGDPA